MLSFDEVVRVTNFGGEEMDGRTEGPVVNMPDCENKGDLIYAFRRTDGKSGPSIHSAGSPLWRLWNCVA